MCFCKATAVSGLGQRFFFSSAGRWPRFLWRRWDAADVEIDVMMQASVRLRLNLMLFHRGKGI